MQFYHMGSLYNSPKYHLSRELNIFCIQLQWENSAKHLYRLGPGCIGRKGASSCFTKIQKEQRYQIEQIAYCSLMEYLKLQNTEFIKHEFHYIR